MVEKFIRPEGSSFKIDQLKISTLEELENKASNMFNDMLDDYDSDLLKDKVNFIRNKILEENSFYGCIGSMLDLEVTRSLNGKQIPTACTDGKKLVFNPEFLSKLSIKDLHLVVMHEIMHVALGHQFRMAAILKKGIDNYTCQIAADVAVNNELADHGVDLSFNSTEDIPVYMPEYAGSTIENIAIDLYNKTKKNGNDLSKYATATMASTGSGNGNEESEDIDINDEKDGGKEEEDSSKLDSNDNKENKSEDNKETKSTGGDDKKDEKKTLSTFGEVDPARNSNGDILEGNELEEEIEKFSSAMSSLHQTVSRYSGPSNNSKTSQREIDNRFKKSSWKSVLLDEINKKGDIVGINRSALDRQALKLGIFIPDKHRNEINWIVIGLDVSGSICNDTVSEFFDYIEKLRSTTTFKHISVVPFNDSIVNPWIQEIKNGKKISKAVHGYGGTRFSPVFNWVESKIRDKKYGERNYPDICIMLTDLGSNDYGDKPPYQVLWVSTDPVFEWNNPPFGRVVQVG